MSKNKHTIYYTLTDEAPALAVRRLFELLNGFVVALVLAAENDRVQNPGIA